MIAAIGHVDNRVDHEAQPHHDESKRSAFICVNLRPIFTELTNATGLNDYQAGKAQSLS
jgi:hypothetical protein